jgi:hypothetical protein
MAVFMPLETYNSLESTLNKRFTDSNPEAIVYIFSTKNIVNLILLVSVATTPSRRSSSLMGIYEIKLRRMFGF